MMKVGGLVVKVRQKQMVPGSSRPAKYETIEIPKESRRVGHVLKIGNRAGQVVVWCEKGIRYWFMKDCEVV